MIRFLKCVLNALFLAFYVGFQSTTHRRITQANKVIYCEKLNVRFIAIILLVTFVFICGEDAVGQTSTTFHQSSALDNSQNYSNGGPGQIYDVTVNTPVLGLTLTNNVFMRSIAIANNTKYQISSTSSNPRFLTLGSISTLPWDLINLQNNSQLTISGFAKGGLNLASHGNFNIGSGSLLNVAAPVSSASGVGLRKTGLGIAVFSTGNIYSGPTEINGGTLAIAHANALGAIGEISFGGGTLQYNGIATDLSSRFSVAANQTYSINTNGNNVAFATSLTSSGGSLHKSGAGTLTLNGSANTYSGRTTVSDGVLIVTGVLAAHSFDVANGATLQSSNSLSATGTNTINGLVKGNINFQSGATMNGSGKVEGNVVVDNGIVSAGNSLGVMTITGNLSLTSNSMFSIEIDTTTPTASDLIDVSGLLQLNGVQLSLSDISNSGSPVAVGSIYEIVKFGTLSGQFVGLSEGSQFQELGNLWKISYGMDQPGKITLMAVSAVPEPRALILVGSVVAVAVTRRRNRSVSIVYGQHEQKN
jgi:autotransporter-associated beta strand protein